MIIDLSIFYKVKKKDMYGHDNFDNLCTKLIYCQNYHHNQKYFGKLLIFMDDIEIHYLHYLNYFITSLID